MARSKRAGKAHSGGYTRYKTANKETINRIARLTKLAKENPNNEQIPLAIKNVVHRRKTPATPYWKSSTIRIARIFKQFTGKFDKNYFSTDVELFNAALRAKDENKFKNSKVLNPKGSMFSMGARLGWKF